MTSITESSWTHVSNGVLQNLALVPILFDGFISDLGEKTECILSKFADEMRLGGAADTPEGCCHSTRPGQSREKGREGPKEAEQGPA